MMVNKSLKNYIKKHPKLYLKAIHIRYFMNYPPYYINNLNKINNRVIYSKNVKFLTAMAENNRECFFGYYNSSPWSPSEKYIIYLSSPSINEHPTSANEAVIRHFNFDLQKDIPICKTRAWNWQQGCMLKWLNNPKKLTFIYNDFRNGKYLSIIKNLNTGEEQILPAAYYALNEKDNEALSLSFQRLHYFRLGYGYNPGNIKLLPTSEDGIYSLKMKKGKVELLISLNDIIKDFKGPRMEHWVNHIEYNPSCTRVVFLHRYNNGGKRRTRMFTMNTDGSDLYCLCNSGYISHFAWKNDQEILAWAKTSTDQKYAHYHLFKDKANETSIVGIDHLKEDGHPSFSPNGRFILTDTYPDKGGWKRLILYNINEDKKYILGEFYNPYRYKGSLRCDLHPRWNRTGNLVCFDSVHEGFRKMYVIDIESVM
jgi:hypothetical protein